MSQWSIKGHMNCMDKGHVRISLLILRRRLEVRYVIHISLVNQCFQLDCSAHMQ